MCGIAGYKTEERVGDEVLRHMVSTQRHRGPDSEGFYRGTGYQGGMRRLKINDLETGDQPLYNQDRMVALLYNGEIYNSPELRRELEGKGYRFRTHSDGEVICHLYDELGEDLFARLDGMFACALWDERRRRLILARDIPGEKPLYYARLQDGGIAFASEIKSLKRYPGIDLSLDLQAVWDAPTFLWVPEPATLYSGISSLMPGHLLVANASGVRIRDYRPSSTDAPFETPEEAVAQTRSVVAEAVRSRLLSDVPVGCFLSSGLDSSLVTTLAARTRKDLSTFTIAFEDVPDPHHGTADESVAAADYARRLGTRHHTIRVTAQTFHDLLDEFCAAGDQVFGVSSGLGLLAVARAAREAGVKVLLSGDGADECFGGYSWYEHLDRAARRPVMAGVAADVSFQNVGLDLAERLRALSSYPDPARAWAWHYYASESEKRRLLAPEVGRETKTSLRVFEGRDGEWAPESFISHDRDFYLPNEMLRKVDRMTMAFSIEGRAPFVAPSVLAHARRLRLNHMVRDGQLKWALRRAFAADMPADVLSRPKHGFNVPIDRWLKSEWRHLVEESFGPGSALARHGLLHNGSLAAARNLLADPVRLNGHSLFTLIMLNRYLERPH